MAVSPNGKKVYITRSEAAWQGTVACNAATGAQLWAKQLYGRRGEEAYSVAVSPGRKKVDTTGSSAEADGTSAYTTVACNAATGARLWVKLYQPVSAARLR